jgi:hypothetical protein
MSGFTLDYLLIAVFSKVIEAICTRTSGVHAV